MQPLPRPEPADLIPGIFNFCDSWCERCLFTRRCQNFLLQHADGKPNDDMSAEALAQRLMEALEMTRQYIERQRIKQLPQQTVTTLEMQAVSLPSAAGPQPLTDWCDTYLKATAEWLRDEKNLLVRAGRQQYQEIELGIRSESEAMSLLTALKDAWEVIKWYRTLIPVKVISALQSDRIAGADPELLAYFNGKAKLVLVSVDRSLAAWHTLLEHYPEKTDDVLDMMVLLDRIRRAMQERFPEARAFRRPGLD